MKLGEAIDKRISLDSVRFKTVFSEQTNLLKIEYSLK